MPLLSDHSKLEVDTVLLDARSRLAMPDASNALLFAAKMHFAHGPDPQRALIALQASPLSETYPYS